MQGFVIEEFDAILSTFENKIEKHGIVLSPSTFFLLPSFNLASASVFRFEHNDPKIKEMLRLHTKVIQAVRFDNLAEAFPVLKKILPSVFSYDRRIRMNRTIQQFIRVIPS